MPDFDYAAIECGDVYVDSWTEYSFASDMFTPADSWSLSLGIGSSKSNELLANLKKLRDTFTKGKVVKLWIGHGDKRTLQATGIVDAREIKGDAEGTKFHVSGRDLAAYLVDSAAEPGLYEKDDTFVNLARKALAKWPDLKVVADPSAGRDVRMGKQNAPLEALRKRAYSLGIPPQYISAKILAGIDAGTINPDAYLRGTQRSLQANELGFGSGLDELSPLQIYQLKVKDARPQSGETVWEFLERHAKRLGFMMRMSPSGELVLGGLDYSQEPKYKLSRHLLRASIPENNILSGGERIDAAQQYRTVRVYGRAKGNDASRSPFVGEAVDKAADAIPHEKTLMLHDNSIVSVEEAQKRAVLELARARQGSHVLDYMMRGHGVNGVVFATDTVAQVEDDVAGVSGPQYVIARTFARNQAQGPTTELKLVDLGSIALA